MRASSIGLLLLVLGIALGGALGFVLGSSAGSASSEAGLSSPDEPATRALEPEGPSAESAGADLAEAAAPESRGSSESPAPRLDPRVSAAARSAASRIDASGGAEAPRHEGVIEGTLKDELGQPIVGAAVLSRGLSPRSQGEVTGSATDSLGRGWREPGSLEDELERYAQRRARERAALRPVPTDEDGRFRLEGLEPGVHLIQAVAEGYHVEAPLAKTGGFVAMIGNRVGEFRIDVIGADGRPLEEATVMVLDSSDRETAKSWTREQPVVRLTRRSARLRVLAGRVLAYSYGKHTAAEASPARLVDLDVDGEGPHVFTLEPQDQLRVQVEDPTSEGPAMTAWVKFRKVDEDGRPKEMFKDQQFGPFVALAPEPGSYELTAGRSSGDPEVTEVVEIVPGMNEVTLALPELDSSRFLIARCRTIDGKAVSRVSFSYRIHEEDGGISSSGIPFTQRSPGEYWVDVSRLRQRIEGKKVEVWLDAKSARYGSVSERCEIGGGPVEFRFSVPCDLTIQLARAGRRRFRVDVKPVLEGGQKNSFSYGSGSKVIGANGSIEYGHLQPGKVEVFLYLASDDLWPKPLNSVETTVPSGPHVLTITAPELHELVVHAPDMEEGAPINISRFDGESNWMFVTGSSLDGALRARFADLVPGQYQIASRSPTKSRIMQVEVPCGEVQFEDMVVRGYRVSSVVSGKLAERAGLLDGDLILSVAGCSASEHNFVQRFWLELTDGATELTIERDGKAMTVTIGAIPEEVEAWSVFGASITPSS